MRIQSGIGSQLPFHFPEGKKEQRYRGAHGYGIGNGFCHEYRKHFVFKEVRQNVNQRYQQDDLPQQGQEQGGFAVSDGDKGLLACQLGSKSRDAAI